MDEPTEIKSETKRAGGFVHWVVWFIVVFLLYVLSFGPMMGLLVRSDGFGKKAGPMVQVIYTPVFWISNRPILQKPFDAYVLWWIELLAEKQG